MKEVRKEVFGSSVHRYYSQTRAGKAHPSHHRDDNAAMEVRALQYDTGRRFISGARAGGSKTNRPSGKWQVTGSPTSHYPRRPARRPQTAPRRGSPRTATHLHRSHPVHTALQESQMYLQLQILRLRCRDVTWQKIEQPQMRASWTLYFLKSPWVRL